MWNQEAIALLRNLEDALDSYVTPQITRACEICGGYTDTIEDHICGYCRHALALMIRDWDHNRR